MYTSILSATMQGIRAIPVQVEVDVSPGLPGFSMVGTVNSQVREAQDRVRTALHNLEYVNISYMNQYRNMADEYGDGYPRPILFVNEDFNESIIEDHTRQYSYYTYKLIKVSEGSKEQKFLNEVKAMKEKILSIPVDRKGKYVAILHYALMDKLNNL